MSERFPLTNKNTIEMLDLLLKNSEYIDFTGRIKQKDIKESKKQIKKLREKISKGEIDIEEDDWSD